jgi:hypothetical protein
MVTQNSIDSNIPIEISKGGTNATSMTNTDGVCYFDGTSIVTTAAGTAGQILTSNGAGIAPTFQATVTGSLVLINTLTASNSATLVFDSSMLTGAYKNYVFKMNGIIPVTDATTLNMVVSVDNGATYKGAGTYQSGVPYISWNGTTWSNSNTNNSSYLSPATGLSATYAYLGEITLSNPIAGNYVIWYGNFFSGGNIMGLINCYTNTGGVAVNNVKFYSSSGNISSGTISLYGVYV